MFRLIYRGILIYIAFLLFVIGFMSSVTKETGSASFYPFIIPIVGAIAINLFLPKLGKARLVLPSSLGILFIGTAFFKYGGFINYTTLGLSACIVFFHALRPWED